MGVGFGFLHFAADTLRFCIKRLKPHFILRRVRPATGVDIFALLDEVERKSCGLGIMFNKTALCDCGYP